MTDCIVIGGGPAGVSAALYTAGAGYSTKIIAKDTGALKNAERIMNYYGFPGGVEGSRLQMLGIEQAVSLGAEFVDDEIFKVSPATRGFEVIGAGAKYEALCVLIATGSKRNTPLGINVSRFEGSGISYCAVCDGFLYRDKKIAVLGDGDFARHEISDLQNFTADITLLTNGSEKVIDGLNIPVDRRRIKELNGQGRLSGITFEDGSTLPIDGLFIALGSAGAIDFARNIGIITEKGRISIDRNGATNVPGIFAAGDSTEEFKQVAVAVGGAAVAGHAIARYLRALKSQKELQ